ncbi:MAG: DUF5698 domain-containing protein [Leptolyngbyaceae bacterium]|nr:DUF5698 domain-containing protein [Leptolyngbyaceae bacterium]
MITETIFGTAIIFCSRLTDVTIGTLRISMLVRGYRKIAVTLSFIESLLWLFATSKAIQGIDDPLKFLAFGAGFASGTLLGSMIDGWLALGDSAIRVIAPVHSPPVAEALRQMGINISVLNASGADGEARITFGIIPNRRKNRVLQTISAINPKALVSIDAVTTADLTGYAISHPQTQWYHRLIKR